MTRRFIIDLSDLYTFLSGSAELSGIQRLLLNVVARRDEVLNADLSGETFEVVLGHWNPLHRRYLVFPMPETFETARDLKALAAYPKIDRYSPHKFPNRPLKRFGYRRGRALRRLWNLGVVARFERMRGTSKVAPLEFRRGDVLLSMGSGWIDEVMCMLEWARPAVEAGDVTPIVLVHDLIPFQEGIENHAAWKVAAFTDWFDRVASFVDHFLVYSDSTRRDLEEQLGKRGRQDARVAKFPLAHEFPIPETGASGAPNPLSAEIAAIMEEPYVLCVGQLTGRKNGNRLAEAWNVLMRRGMSARLPRLVFAGSVDASDLVVDLDDATRARIVLVNRPTDLELSRLYERALFCVVPSLYEGWGLPIGEALWHGKLCVASGVSSMGEVGGDLVDYFDPTSADSIADAVARPLEDPGYLASREADVQKADLRSWRDSTRMLFEAAYGLLEGDAAPGSSS